MVLAQRITGEFSSYSSALFWLGYLAPFLPLDLMKALKSYCHQGVVTKRILSGVTQAAALAVLGAQEVSIDHHRKKARTLHSKR